MDNYIVRINRCDSVSPRQISGIVENVRGKETTPFKNYEELLKLMAEIPTAADLTFRVE